MGGVPLHLLPPYLSHFHPLHPIPRGIGSLLSTLCLLFVSLRLSLALLASGRGARRKLVGGGGGGGDGGGGRGDGGGEGGGGGGDGGGEEGRGGGGGGGDDVGVVILFVVCFVCLLFWVVWLLEVGEDGGRGGGGVMVDTSTGTDGDVEVS